MDLTAGLVVANRFQLVRELGHGGMGSVWLAHHTGLDTSCALKFIHQDAASNEEVRARFEREAKAAAQIRSSHVVQILDYGVWQNTPYIAMELLEGEDLAARVKRVPRMQAREVAHIVAQVSRALAKAHQAGLVHRDLKPENIFLVREDDQEIAKVLDFGIAKSHENLLASNSNTKTGSLLGTPHYMSPEQAQGTKTVDHRTDIWALAVVAFRCLTGKLPFDSDALGDLLLKIIVNPVPVPSQMCPDLPTTFDQWWLRATNRDVAQRFQSAKEMSDALQVALGLSQAAHPMSAQPSGVPGAASTAPMNLMGSTPNVVGPMGSTPNLVGAAREPAYSQPGMMASPAVGHTPGVEHPTTMQAGGHGALGAPGTFGPGVSSYGQAPPAQRGPGRIIAGVVGALVVGGILAVFVSKGGDDAAKSAASSDPDTVNTEAPEGAEDDAPDDDTTKNDGDTPEVDPVASADAPPSAVPSAEPTVKAAAKPPPVRPTGRPPPTNKPPPPPPPPPPQGGGRDFGF